MNPLADLARALGFLTVLPVGREWPEEGASGAVGWYPWVGLLLGAVAWLIAWLLSLAGAFSASTLLVGGALVIAAWALLTRMLHWDGLADTVDAVWGAYERERRLEIMRDSRIGAFGATAVVLAALLQVSSAGAVLAADRAWVLLMAPVLGRLAASLAAWTLPAASTRGLGATHVGRPRVYDVVVAALAVLAVLVVGHLTAPRGTFFATLVLGLVAAVVLPRLLARQVGGMTGDLFGASVLLTETVVLVAGALLP